MRALIVLGVAAFTPTVAFAEPPIFSPADYPAHRKRGAAPNDQRGIDYALAVLRETRKKHRRYSLPKKSRALLSDAVADL